jgi:hypothetical protein
LGLVQPACPLCKSSIAERPVLPDHCSLCTQRYPGTVDPQERQMLMAVRETVKADLAAAHGEVGTAQQRADAAHAAAKRVHDGFNQLLKEPVSPYADALAAASAAVHQIEGELAALAALVDAHRRLQRQRQDIDRLKAEQEERRREHVADEAELESARDVVNALNEIFRSVIATMDLPHATGRAEVDPHTLLPLVDDQSFEQRGGGARSAVAIAYSLTLLIYTLGNELAQLPSLLMIDSPKKNFGANDDDSALAKRVYDGFLNARSLRADLKDDRFDRPYQLIIVDNDIHEDVEKRVLVHRFERGEGFIRGLREPHGPHEQGELDLDT